MSMSRRRRKHEACDDALALLFLADGRLDIVIILFVDPIVNDNDENMCSVEHKSDGLGGTCDVYQLSGSM